MNQKLYKNIALSIILACSIQATHLQCGWFKSLTGQIATALTSIKNHPYITCGLVAVTAFIGHQVKRALRPWQDNDLGAYPIDIEELAKLKPFASKEELRQEYTKLYKIETTFSSRTDAETISNYYKALMLFYQRLFRYIVKLDIKERLEYTIDLDFTVTKDDKLEMGRLPAKIKDNNHVKENRCLFKLSINPKDEDASRKLKKLIEKRSNKAKDKNTAKFFPKIILLHEEQKNSSLSDDDSNRRTVKEIDPWNRAFYGPIRNEIVLRKKYFSIHAFDMMVHEFTHRLQLAQGPARGGSYSGLLDTKTDYAHYPSRIADEIEAETRSLVILPEEILLELKRGWYLLLNRIIPAFDKIQTIGAFPYFTPTQKYEFLVDKYNFSSEESYKKAGLKACEIRKKIGTQIMKKYLNFNSAGCCRRLVESSHQLKKDFNKQTMCLKRTMLKQKNLTEEQKKKINNAQNYLNGSTEFFQLKTKILGWKTELN